MSIRVTTPVGVTKYLKKSDPEEKTYVIIKPGGYAAEIERDEMLRDRSVGRVSVNLSALWALEIWLTYQETNLEVKFTDKEGNVTKTIKFEPKEQMTRDEFIRRLTELPSGIVFEWHSAVVEVVPDWAVPF